MGQSICLERCHNDNNSYDDIIFGKYSNRPSKSIVVEFKMDEFYLKKKIKRKRRKKYTNLS